MDEDTLVASVVNGSAAARFYLRCSLRKRSVTLFIKKLYHEYRIEISQAKRAINSVPDKRGTIDEVLVPAY